MNSDPVEIALGEITAAKRLLESLITSSESFDYFKAKAALGELRDQLRILGKIEAELAARRTTPPGRIIPFPLPHPWEVKP